MKKKFKILSVMLLSFLMFMVVGCTNSTTDNSSSKNNSTTENNSSEATSKEDYYNYLTDRYNYYFGNSKLFNDYDIYSEDFVYNGTNEEFLVEYNNSYADLKVALESFKTDLKNYVKKGTAEVDDLNAQVITAIDKAIISVDDYSGTFGEKTKDYATLAKDEMLSGLKDIGKASHDAMADLKNLVDNAKTKLGIS